ncbi:MAG: hypothetical protein K0Q77_45 [Anaerosporomusa subterranea]|nr:hypothetical protein [Anaerosporomusa subterranea]MDF2572312.1 hypothetical protein [Sporomusa sp.]
MDLPVYEKIGQITEDEFKKLQFSTRQQAMLKKFMGLSAKDKYQLGDTTIVIKDAELYGLYKYDHKGRNIYYLIANIIDDHMAFSWNLYPVN